VLVEKFLKFIFKERLHRSPIPIRTSNTALVCHSISSYFTTK